MFVRHLQPDTWRAAFSALEDCRNAVPWMAKEGSQLPAAVWTGQRHESRSRLFCLTTTINDFRDLHDAALAYPVLDQLSQHPEAPGAPGPCKALVERLRQIDWVWLGSGFIRDHDGLEWHLIDAAVQWLNVRLRQAWARHVGAITSNRHTFGGLQCVDIQLMHEGLHKFTPAEQGFLRIVQNGSFFTRELLFQTGKVPDKGCPFCDSQDSLAHRLWECPFFSHIRLSLDQEALHWLKAEPTCFLLRGWVVEHSCQVAFRKSLMDIPDELFQICWPVRMPEGDLHFFTDGSCSHPDTPGLRLGTWACTVADLAADVFHPIASGGIPGGHQTTLRAEICGAIAAFFAGLQSGRGFTLWVDNQTVYSRVRRFLTEGVSYAKPKAANHDLWNRLARLCAQAVQSNRLRNVVKVRSHEHAVAYPELVERWAIAGNHAADQHAEAARDGLPGHVLTYWKASCVRVAKARRMRDAMRGLITKSAFLATATKTATDKQTEGAWQQQLEQPRKFDLRELSVTPLPPLDVLPPRHSLGAHAVTIHNWIKTLNEGRSIKPLWLSSHHLLIHFQGTTGLKGFRFNQRNNKWDAIDQEDPAHFEFHKAANAFQAAVK